MQKQHLTFSVVLFIIKSKKVKRSTKVKKSDMVKQEYYIVSDG